MLSRLTEDMVRDAVDEVVDELAKVGEFTMSKPRDEMHDVETQSKGAGNLSITFEYGHDGSGNSFIWIFCWYYDPRDLK